MVAAMDGQASQDAHSTSVGVAKGRLVRFAAGSIGEGEEFKPSTGKLGSWPGIVLVPDSPGLNDFIRRQATELAAKGYLVLAVDLYGGRMPSDPAEADKWIDLLRCGDATRILKGAVSYLQNWMADPTNLPQNPVFMHYGVPAF
jgi:hypothetical protein